ncbi:MAG: hypothetical protein ACXWXZ_04030 [Candidatus Binatia bacterium]
MASITVSGGDRLRARLDEIARNLGTAKKVSVGYLAGSKMIGDAYTDHPPVALIAAIQNFGAPGASIPARPFFTNMVREHSGEWGEDLGEALAVQDYDGARALDTVGQLIGEQLQDSVRETYQPALSPVTVMLRGMRSVGGPNFRVTGATVGEAAQRVADGKTNYGASTKPLIDTPAANLLNAVDHTVE